MLCCCYGLSCRPQISLARALDMRSCYSALSTLAAFAKWQPSAVKIKQDFLGVKFCCPMEIVPPQMKIQCDRCVIFHSVSSSLSVASLSCLFAVETSLYPLLKHVPVDPFISFSFIHSSLTLLKCKKVNFAYYKLKGTVSQGFCSRLIPLKSQ